MGLTAADLHFATNQRADAVALIKRFHYSGRIPANVEFFGTLHVPGGLFGDMGAAVAAICFSHPPTRWSLPVLELSRLVRHDRHRVPLTRLVAISCRYIKRAGLGDLLVSFADSGMGHHGGIYQAASWKYHGMRAAGCDGVVIDGVFIPGRTCNARWGTRSPERLRA